ncbi:MAG: hypothetical protein R3C61_20330 [Bacteroidia bacterium]
MLRNFLVTAYRNFVRQKGYTLLNVLGLTIGVSSSIFILLYLTNELVLINTICATKGYSDFFPYRPNRMTPLTE